MRVYYFVESIFALENIKYKRLKVAEIMKLNDPFEFFSLNLTDNNLRKAVKRAKENFSKHSGIICFSRNWQSPVQWAHYADNHKGLCLGFDISDHLLNEVTYIEKPIEFSGGIHQIQLDDILVTKFEHWDYEEEFRLFIKLDKINNGLYFEPFSEDIVLSKVIIGLESDVTYEDIVQSYGKNIDVVKVKAAYDNFQMVEK